MRAKAVKMRLTAACLEGKGCEDGVAEEAVMRAANDNTGTFHRKGQNNGWNFC
jgi:hypothetical protein